MPSDINISLTQQGLLGQLREYQLQQGKQLKIAIGSKVRNKVYQVHLLALADKSKVKLHIAWPWFWCMLISLLAVPVYFMGKKLLELPSGMHEFAILAVLSIGVLLGLVMLIMNFSRRRVFYSRFAHVPLFDILISKPDKRAYKNFLDVLHASMQEMRTGHMLKPDQQIAGEMRMLRRLASEGVIAQREYERAKDKLFGISNKSARRN